MTGISASQSVIVVAAASMLMIALGLYGFVRTVTGRALGAVIAVALVLGGPTQWDQLEAQAGLVPKIAGHGLRSGRIRDRSVLRQASVPAEAAGYGLGPGRTASVHPLAAALMGAIVAVVLVVMSADRRLGLLQAGAVGAASLALDGYFYVPYVLQNVRQNLGDPALQPVPWSSLARVSSHDLASWSPVFIPAVLVGVITASVVWWRLRLSAQVAQPELPGVPLRRRRGRRRRCRTPRRPATAASLAAAAAAIAAYCLAGHFKHSFVYLTDLDPTGLLTYPEWLLRPDAGSWPTPAAT